MDRPTNFAKSIASELGELGEFAHPKLVPYNASMPPLTWAHSSTSSSGACQQRALLRLARPVRPFPDCSSLFYPPKTNLSQAILPVRKGKNARNNGIGSIA